MSSLNSMQILKELEGLGCRRFGNDVIKVYRLRLPGSEEAIYIKRKADGSPMNERPLVIALKHARQPYWSELVELSPNPDMAAKSSNYAEFPEKTESKSGIGIAFNIPDAQVLARFVELLGGNLISRVGVSAASSAPDIAADGEGDSEGISDDEMLALAGAQQMLAGDLSFKQAPETVRQQLIEARIGQGRFRQELMVYWQRQCAVTGAAVAETLIASHIKPWAQSDNTERLDAYNGLLLSANLDRLFDRGLIGFADDGRLIRSNRISEADLARLGIAPDARLCRVVPQHLPYLAHHRQAFGL